MRDLTLNPLKSHACQFDVGVQCGIIGLNLQPAVNRPLKTGSLSCKNPSSFVSAVSRPWFWAWQLVIPACRPAFRPTHSALLAALLQVQSSQKHLTKTSQPARPWVAQLAHFVTTRAFASAATKFCGLFIPFGPDASHAPANQSKGFSPCPNSLLSQHWSAPQQSPGARRVSTRPTLTAPLSVQASARPSQALVALMSSKAQPSAAQPAHCATTFAFANKHLIRAKARPVLNTVRSTMLRAVFLCFAPGEAHV